MAEKKKTPLDEKFVPFEEKEWKEADKENAANTHRIVLQRHDVLLLQMINELNEAKAQIAFLMDHIHADGKVLIPIKKLGEG